MQNAEEKQALNKASNVDNQDCLPSRKTRGKVIGTIRYRGRSHVVVTPKLVVLIPYSTLTSVDWQEHVIKKIWLPRNTTSQKIYIT